DERGALGSDDLASALVPELVVGDNAARQVIEAALLVIDEIAVLANVLLLLERRGLFVAERLLVAQAARPFERRARAELPDAFDIALAVGRADRGPLPTRLGRG